MAKISTSPPSVENTKTFLSDLRSISAAAQTISLQIYEDICQEQVSLARKSDVEALEGAGGSLLIPPSARNLCKMLEGCAGH